MKKSLLLTAVFASLSVIFPQNSVLAYDTAYVDGKNFSYQFDIFNPGETINFGEEIESSFEITDEYKQPFLSAAKQWADIISSNADRPIKYAVLAFDEYNAGASSLPVIATGIPYNVTSVNAAINNLVVTQLYDFPYDGIIFLGLGISKNHEGWAPFTGYHSLYHGEIPDLNVVILHEIMHSLGLTAYSSNGAEFANVFYGAFDRNLKIYTGEVDGNFYSNKEIKYQKGWAAGNENSDFDVINNSPYFDGEETVKVLGGKNNYEEAKQAIIDNGGLTNYSEVYSANQRPNVYGLPIHPYDGNINSEYKMDLSHIELRNSFMSHQNYRNWLVPMEAELAVLKDLGYEVDLRRFFGKSYYLNGVTDVYTQGFSEWNGTNYTGNPSNVIQAVGMHIYGNNNNITQDSNILTNGEGSFGVRIDGVGNTYTLASGSNILSNGKENIALGATWGKNHTINIENGAKISALGEDGIAASFDFGNGLLGIYAETKGSFIDYFGEYDYNLTPDEETQGALVDNFNVSGILEGGKAAIYISDKAWVKNINIKDGAEINGDIKSDWNSVSSDTGAKVTIEDTVIYEGQPYTYYRQRDISNPDEMLNTNLNFTGKSRVNGNITGDNGINNTLIMNNSGNVNFDGETIAVKIINNSGALNLSENVENVGNVVNLEENSLLSTKNDKAQNVKIGQLNSDNANIAIDLGDTFTIENVSETGKDNAKISLIKVDEDTAKSIDEIVTVDLFTDNTLNLTNGANFYYDGNKYEIKQNDLNKKILSVNKDTTTTGFELGDAANDSTTGNYIVTENALTKDAGTVKSSEFIITGKDINVNGNKGIVIDGTQNTNGTILKTSIYGANDSDLTVQNNGYLSVSAENKSITLGKTDGTAITINNGEVLLNADNNEIDIKGAIQGNDKTNDFVGLTGQSISLNKTDNVTITTEVPNVDLNGIETNTNWIVNNGTLNVNKDSYLSSDGTNSLTFNGCGVNLINDIASDINLESLTLNDKMEAQIDVDLKNKTTDRFVFDNQNDVTTNGNKVEIIKVNLLNPNTALTHDKYEIPFASSKYNSENLVRNVEANIDRNLLTPVYKYRMTYEDNGTEGNIALNRSNTGGYEDYNPAVYTGAVAAQAGGYLNQINSYETAFSNMDMITSMPKSIRNAMKLRNKYATSEANLITYNPNQFSQEGKGLWVRPYATFEKVNMKNGPKVKNTGYGSYIGGDTKLLEIGRNWDGVFSLYAGYNGSHQSYQGNSIYQNGGQLGGTGVFYKDNFFTGLTANIGSSIADASNMYGDDDIVLLTTGIASKTGYNFGFKNDKFIIQPNYLMSYSLVNTFDYTNSAGVRIKSDPMNAVQIVPGVKFIGNLNNGWQPYLGVQIVWNIMDKTKFKANDAYLEQISIKPYVQYGVGVQKQQGERLTGYAQSMIRNGGRNGLSLTAGFRWKV